MEERGRVWVLEDSPLEAEMARRALAPSQEVVLYDDGSVVLEKIANGTVPDVLVLDSQLIGVSGLEVCRVVRATQSSMTLPIIMLTVQGAQHDIVEALEAGANDYVIKPYHVAELVARVRTLVNTSRLFAQQSVRTRQLSLSADVGLALSESRGVEAVAQRVAEAVMVHLGAARVEVRVARPELELVLAGSAGTSDVAIPVSIQDVARRERRVVTHERAFVVPLYGRDEILGVLAVQAPAVEPMPALATAANLLALGIERGRADEERISLLERERNARAEAEAANRSKDDFLAMVSHELRTPLNAITGWTSLLQSGALDGDRARRAYDTIDRNARSQAQLIDDLLDIGRITSGTLRLNESTFEVASIAEMAFESIRPTAENQGVQLESKVDPNVGRMTGDMARVQQVVWNLLANAIKFTPKGGTITLSVTRENDEITIAVTDTGQGIDAAFLPRVFDRFKQADTSSTRARGGLGLGLAIVRHLVELHGGTIEASSEGVGKGSTFKFTIPSSRSRSISDSLVVKNPDDLRSDRRRELEGLRILVVDDEPDARELLRTFLESCKAIVTIAASAAEAMTQVLISPPDVLLSDVAMPEEDGLSFIRRVRELPEDKGGGVRAVALTAYARLEDRTRALRAGFNAHVAKPVDPNELVLVLHGLAPRRM